LSIASISSNANSVSVSSSVNSNSVASTTAVNTQPDAIVPSDSSDQNIIKDATSGQNTGTNDNKHQPSEDYLTNVTNTLNDFMQSMNTDIKFVLHPKTDTLVIQVVDSKTHKVLRQYPSQEFLDMVARMHDYMGMLVDKKV
jgi:flagellar protein FlaG